MHSLPTQWLEGKLDLRETITSEDIHRIINEFSGTVGAKRETAVLDFKERFDATALGRVSITKSLCEFANSGGGLLLYGVDDSGNRIGVSADTLDRLDPAKIQDYLGKYISATGLSINVIPVTVSTMHFVAVVVYPSLVPIVMEQDGEYEVATSDGLKKKTAFHEGTILVREGSKGVRAAQTHINKLIDRLAGERSRLLLRRIEMVAKLPEHADLIAVAPGSVRGARLLGAEQGIPVQIVDDSSATALPVTEILTSAPFGSPRQAQSAQVRLYNTDPTYRVPAKTVARWYLDKTELTDLDSIHELAFLSALRGYGFPMFWAASIDRQRLRTLVERIISSEEWPDILAIPYVVGAFFWEEREHLLRAMPAQRYPSAKKNAQRVLRMNRQEFFYRARAGAKQSVTGPDGSLVTVDLSISGRESSVELFEHLVASFINDTLKMDRPVAHQLDICIFGDPIPAE